MLEELKKISSEDIPQNRVKLSMNVLKPMSYVGANLVYARDPVIRSSMINIFAAVPSFELNKCITEEARETAIDAWNEFGVKFVSAMDDANMVIDGLGKRRQAVVVYDNETQANLAYQNSELSSSALEKFLNEID